MADLLFPIFLLPKQKPILACALSFFSLLGSHYVKLLSARRISAQIFVRGFFVYSSESNPTTLIGRTGVVVKMRVKKNKSGVTDRCACWIFIGRPMER